MRYLFLTYSDERALEAMPQTERDMFASACQANDEALRQGGRLLYAQGIQSSCTTVRVERDELCVGDGPLIATSEQLVGIFTVEARDLNEAIQVAARMPQARGGPIEVRPVAE